MCLRFLPFSILPPSCAPAKTLDRCRISVRGIFAEGQLYVALVRRAPPTYGQLAAGINVAFGWPACLPSLYRPTIFASNQGGHYVSHLNLHLISRLRTPFLPSLQSRARGMDGLQIVGGYVPGLVRVHRKVGQQTPRMPAAAADTPAPLSTLASAAAARLDVYVPCLTHLPPWPAQQVSEFYEALARGEPFTDPTFAPRQAGWARGGGGGCMWRGPLVSRRRFACRGISI